MSIAKALAKSLGILAGLYLFFRHVGDFPSRQSGAIALLGWLGYGLYNELKTSV